MMLFKVNRVTLTEDEKRIRGQNLFQVNSLAPLGNCSPSQKLQDAIDQSSTEVRAIFDKVISTQQRGRADSE